MNTKLSYDGAVKRVVRAYRKLAKLDCRHSHLKFLNEAIDGGLRYCFEHKSEFEERFGGQGISHVTILGNYEEALKEATLEAKAEFV